MDATSARLERIGDELESAARRDLPKRPLPRRLALAAVLLVILAPAAAFAGERLMSNDDVAQSMPAGTLSLAGTQPTCTTVTRDVEYHCALTNAPAPEVSDWKGTVEPTVDKTKHVNGGCRSLNSAGPSWSPTWDRPPSRRRSSAQDFLGEYCAVARRGLARQGEVGSPGSGVLRRSTCAPLDVRPVGASARVSAWS